MEYWVVRVLSPLGWQNLTTALRRGRPHFGDDLPVRLRAETADPQDRRGDYLIPDLARQIIQSTEITDPGLNRFFNSIGQTRSWRIPEREALEALARDGRPGERPSPPDDGAYSRALRDIRVPQAHARHPDALANLSQVRVGHIDTGVTRHPCFGFPTLTAPDDASWLRLAEGTDLTREQAWPPVDPWPMELPYAGYPGHGTRTASVLCGWHADAAGDPVFQGVAPKATVIPWRIGPTVILDVFSASPLDRAYRQALDRRCDVVSLSMGAPRGRASVAAAVNALYEAGVIMVCAAGNVVPWVVWPARFARTIAVGGSKATPDGDVSAARPWAGGSHGPAVDICAPADEVLRAGWNGVNPTAVPTYSAYSGTSYATAQTAGAAALWLAKHGVDRVRARYPGWRTVEVFRKLVQETACRPAGWDHRNFGAGILDVEALLDRPFDQLPVVTDGDRRVEATA